VQVSLRAQFLCRARASGESGVCCHVLPLTHALPFTI
jgi:hypothetical protein